MSWSDAYLGLSEDEAHCWELARRIYARELGIKLPDYEGSVVSAAERAEVAALVGAEAARPIWRAVSRDEIVPFDIVVFRRGEARSHIGVAVDRLHIIHMLGHARIDRLSDPAWSGRLAGVYRHVDAPVEAPVERPRQGAGKGAV